MVELLAELAARNAEVDDFTGLGPAVDLRRRLEALDESSAPIDVWAVCRSLAAQELRLGNTQRAIDLYSRAIALHETLRRDSSSRAEVRDDQLVDDLYQRGLSHLRRGETINCVHGHNADSCLFPIRAGGVHGDPSGSERAIEDFRRALESDPEHRGARWLWNLAAMTLGQHPEGVPEEFQLDERSIRERGDVPRFFDQASKAGVAVTSLSGGLIVDDFDGDGLFDLMVSDWHPSGPLRFFRGDGEGAFEERTEDAGIVGITGGLNLVHADYDGDGDLDVLVLRGAWLRTAGDLPNSLLQNDGNGRFTDVTFEAGLGEVFRPTQTAAFGDVDGDGDLDLFIGNETDRSLRAPCQLFRNKGDGTFRDVARQAGVTNDRYAKSCSFGDYDEDGDLDLYVSNLGAPNRLYRNRGDGRFDDVAGQLGVDRPLISFPCFFWDFDNDGHLDLFVANYDTKLPHAVARFLDVEPQTEPSRLYRGDGRGAFEEVGAELGLDAVTLPMGHNFGDFDSDGFVDVYLGTGYPHYEALVPNVMFKNLGGEAFLDVSVSGGFGHLQKGHAIAFADHDRDGDQDVFVELGGAFPGDAFRNALLENPGFGNHWIEVRLSARSGNTFGLGARLRVDVLESGKRRTVYRRVTSGGSFGGSPLTQAIGLGKATQILAIEVLPVGARAPMRFEAESHDLEVDTRITIDLDSATIARR
ncbi:MAG: VCBS repeat-containing protein [Planctomycetota bacterium]